MNSNSVHSCPLTKQLVVMQSRRSSPGGCRHRRQPMLPWYGVRTSNQSHSMAYRSGECRSSSSCFACIEGPERTDRHVRSDVYGPERFRPNRGKVILVRRCCKSDCLKLFALSMKLLPKHLAMTTFSSASRLCRTSTTLVRSSGRSSHLHIRASSSTRRPRSASSPN